MLPLSPAEETSFVRLVRWRVRQWRDDPDYEDILAESYLTAWESYLTALDRGMECPLSYAVKGAAWGPPAWRRRWFGDWRAKSVRAFECVPLDEARDVPVPPASGVVLDRVEGAALWEHLRRYATPRQVIVLERLFLREETVTQVARALSAQPSSVVKLRDRALAHCRRTFGQPGAPVRPGESYPCCAAGHPSSPENRRPERRNGLLQSYRCRICENEKARCRRKRRQGARAGQEMASGPSPLSPLPPAENARGVPP